MGIRVMIAANHASNGVQFFNPYANGEEAMTVRPQDIELIVQLVLAAILAGVLGWERGMRGQAAGLRTYMLVSMAAASFTQVGAYAFLDSNAPHDPLRVGAQVVTGIGFLGAGAIWRTGVSPRGLTTAAGLWVSAALGMLSAASFYFVAIAATVLAWLILRGGYWLEQRMGVKPAGSQDALDDGNPDGEEY
jgi:putative Mg2+ transporter-C (MgtC) family protein